MQILYFSKRFWIKKLFDQFDIDTLLAGNDLDGDKK
jgi:hypothetical protein